MQPQPQFELTEKDVTFSHMNTRTEKHGEDDVLAVDLDMSMATENDNLAMFHPTLKWSLYDKPDIAGADLVDKTKAEQLIRLRYPLLPAIRWDLEMVNVKVTFHYGIAKRSDLVLQDCKVNKFRIEPKDGGTVQLAWRVQANPTHE